MGNFGIYSFIVLVTIHTCRVYGQSIETPRGVGDVAYDTDVIDDDYNIDYDIDDDVDEDETFGDALSSFLSNVFGEGTSVDDVANVKINSSTKATMESFLSNATDRGDGTAAPLETVAKKPYTTTAYGDLPTELMTTPMTTTTTTPFQQPKTEDSHCTEFAYLTNFCEVPDDMSDLVFWDLYRAIFSDIVLDELVIQCSTGTWCLKTRFNLDAELASAMFQKFLDKRQEAAVYIDRFDFWDAELAKRVDMMMNSEIGFSMCKPEVTPCYEKIADFYTNCTDHTQMEFTSEAIKLVCHLLENADASETCIKQTLVSLHVTVADVMRSVQEPASTGEDHAVCESAEVNMTSRLICMENSCPGEGDVFRDFVPWLWFTNVVDDLIDRCNLDPTTCFDVLKVGETSTSAPVTSSSTSSTTSSSYTSTQTSSLLAMTESKKMTSPNKSNIISSESRSNVSDVMPRADIEEFYAIELIYIVGGSVAIAVVAVVMALLACTLYRRHQRNAVVKEGYQKLLSDPDET